MSLREHTLEDPDGLAWLIYLYEEDNLYAVSLLRTHKDHRMEGRAGKLLARLCTMADEQGLPIYLSATPMDHGPTTLPTKPLIEFYNRRGFVPRGKAGYDKLVRWPVAIDCKPDADGVSSPHATSQQG